MVCADLALLPFLCEDVTDQCLLKNFLFDQEMPQTSCWKGLVVLCPKEKKKVHENKVITSRLFVINECHCVKPVATKVLHQKH